MSIPNKRIARSKEKEKKFVDCIEIGKLCLTLGYNDLVSVGKNVIRGKFSNEKDLIDSIERLESHLEYYKREIKDGMKDIPKNN